MKQILVGKQIAYAAKVGGGTISGINQINLLDTGAIAFFTSNNLLITTANAATVLADKKEFYAAVGNQQTAATGSKTFISSMIPRLYSRIDKKGYLPAVNQISYIGYDGTYGSLNYPTVVVGNAATIKLIKTTKGLRNIGAAYESEIMRFEQVARAGDTSATIIARLIVDINSVDTTQAFVVAAAVSTTGIKLTTINSYDTFTVAAGGDLTGSDVGENGMLNRVYASSTSLSIPITYGEGIPAEIAELEHLYSTERGNTNQIWLPQYYYQTPTLVDTTLTYDKTVISFAHQRSTATGNQWTSQNEIILAIPVGGSSPTTTVNTLLDVIFGGIYGAVPIETGSGS